MAKSGSKVGSKQHSKMKVQPGAGKGKGGVPALKGKITPPVYQAGKPVPQVGGNSHGYEKK